LRQNMTNSEIILWNKLKTKKILWKKFLRQSYIYVYSENSGLDRFIIPDFVCKSEKLIIELDWNIHEVDEVYILDREKEKILESLGYRILRFRNYEVKNDIMWVLKIIKEKFK
jgi:very-short-patch-repair endonuclease